MSYVYQSTYDWSVWKRFTSIHVSAFLKKIEEKIREKLLVQPHIKSIQNITHSYTERKRTIMGIYHHEVDGKTIVTFTSDLAPSASPLIPAALVAAVTICLPFIIKALVAIFVLVVAYFVVRAVTALFWGPEGAAAGGLPWGGIIILAIAALFLLPKAVPAVKKVVKEAKKKR